MGDNVLPEVDDERDEAEVEVDIRLTIFIFSLNCFIVSLELREVLLAL